MAINTLFPHSGPGEQVGSGGNTDTQTVRFKAKLNSEGFFAFLAPFGAQLTDIALQDVWI